MMSHLSITKSGFSNFSEVGPLQHSKKVLTFLIFTKLLDIIIIFRFSI